MTQPFSQKQAEQKFNQPKRLQESPLPQQQGRQESSFQVLMKITQRIRESLNEEDVFRTTVEELRKALRIDRVVIFRFDFDCNGTFIEESVAPGLPKTLWTIISDPCFKGGYVEQYRHGRVHAIDDIHQANLTDCHIELLERFGVKSSLIAPILKNNQLFGLLIAHQCSGPRFWQQSEIDFFAQIATQVGFAVDYARLLERIDRKADQAQIFINITHRIRRSLNEEDVLKTTVEEVRKLSQVVSLMSNIASQIKLQLMNTALEASRTPEVGQKFAMLADQVLSELQQLNTSIAEIESLVVEIQTQANEADVGKRPWLSLGNKIKIG
jgi:GAF domain-containing protein